MPHQFPRQVQQPAGAHDQKRAPQPYPEWVGQQRTQHVEGGDQKQETEGHLDAIHPRPRLGQEAIAHCHQQHQRRTDPQAQREQHQATVQGVAALGDVQQRRGQRCGHARAHQQPGQHTQRAGPGEAAAPALAAGLLQPITQAGRQLQLEEAEHGQRQEHEQASEACDQPRLHQPSLQIRTQ